MQVRRRPYSLYRLGALVRRQPTFERLFFVLNERRASKPDEAIDRLATQPLPRYT